MLYDSFRAMNTDVLVAAEGSEALVTDAFQGVREYVHAAENRFSRFKDDSELSALNRSSGSWFRASSEMMEIVSLAKEYAAMTGGLFDPTRLGELEAAGYDRSMDSVRASGPGRQRVVERRQQGVHDIELDQAANAIFLPAGVRLDLGGIAKGWIAQRAVDQMKMISPVCAVNAGGDMVSAGLPEEGAWRVALEDPLDPERTLAALSLGPGALATSSITRRAWVQEGKPRHHIIDPRTGEPAGTDWLSMSVVASSAPVAEVYAKVLLIVGKAATRATADACPLSFSFIGVDRDGLLWGSADAGRIVEDGFGRYGPMAASSSLRDAGI